MKVLKSIRSQTRTMRLNMYLSKTARHLLGKKTMAVRILNSLSRMTTTDRSMKAMTLGGQLFIDTSDDHSEDFVDQDKDSEDENEGRMHLCVKDDEPAVNSHRPPTPGTGQRNDYVRGEKERRGTSNTKRTIPSRLNHTRRVAIDARVTFFFSRVLPRRY